MRRTDPLILGAGPAGSAAAIALARAGAKPLILERSAETGDALCGGFLSWRTLAQLESLGIATQALGGHPATRLVVFAGQRRAEAPLPGGAIGLSRFALDTAMNATACAAGAGIERGVAVRHVDDRLRVNLANGEQHPQSLFLATGKHDVRGVARHRSAAGDDSTLGLRVKLGPHATLSRLIGDAIELHLFRGGYVGLNVQEDGHANLCLAVRKSRFAECASDPKALFASIAQDVPALGDRLAFLSTNAPTDAIAAIPYGWIATETLPGLFRLGDQAAVIPSLAGEGIGIALASAQLAVEAWHQQGAAGAQAFQSRFAAQAKRPIRTALLLRDLAERTVPAHIGLSLIALAPRLAGYFASRTRIIN
jgi:menaquinone-9 beta-reductase